VWNIIFIFIYLAISYCAHHYRKRIKGMPQEITTKTDQYGNVQSGYYIETPVTELYKGEETSKTVRILWGTST
jgi:hypothetical protein